MEIKVERTTLEDVWVVSHEVHEDARGPFLEVYRRDLFEQAGLPSNFVQINQSRSKRGVVRGLHFQWDPPQGKLMSVVSGRAFLVAVDIRKGSPSLGKWFGITLPQDGSNEPWAPTKQLWAPAGFARGFCVLSEVAEIQYLCTGIYNPQGESGIRWNDPEIGISWPVSDPDLSKRDSNAASFSQWLNSKESDNFFYGR
jgi:dTDP-4-dehydrorhamnose 3,5-epimerase